MAFNGKYETVSDVANLPARDGNELRITVDRYTNTEGNEYHYVHCRIYEPTRRGATATKRGFTIRSVDVARFVNAIKKAQKAIDTIDENAQLRREKREEDARNQERNADGDNTDNEP